MPSNQPAPFTDAADARAATSAFIPNQSLPYSETWNLGIQHVFDQKYTLEVRYVGTRGIHLPVQTRLNRQNKTSLSEYLPTYTTAPSQSTLTLFLSRWMKFSRIPATFPPMPMLASTELT